MTRARGKHTQRPPVIDPESPEGRGFGMSDRTDDDQSPIPGGKIHLTNTPSIRHTPPVPEPQAEYRGTMAHGMPPGTYTTEERAEAERGPDEVKVLRPKYADERPEKPVPVPVYVVPEAGGRYPLKISVPRHITVPGFNGDPVLVCGVDPNRTKIRLMNNDASNNLRIGANPTDLVVDPGSANSRTIGGALLVKGMTGYQDFETQDELWAVTIHATATVELQIIMETSKIGAGGAG